MAPPDWPQFKAWRCLRNPGRFSLRKRWKDAKGRTIYEWDYEKGELEAYRSNDLSHLGSFDPFTGERRGKAKDKRRTNK